MKKMIILPALILFLPHTLLAQQPDSINYAQLILNATIVLVLYIASSFLLSLFKSRQDFQLKSKLIDKGVPDEVISKFLASPKVDTQHVVFRWFLILTSIGTALTLIYYNQPLGIHSIAILVFCLAASFLGYFFYIGKQEKS